MFFKLPITQVTRMDPRLFRRLYVYYMKLRSFLSVDKTSSLQDLSSFVSIMCEGSSAVLITQPKVTPPAKYNTLFMSPPPASPEVRPYKCWAIRGLTMPNSRPQNPASPQAVPRIGAGNASGVQPYRTALNMDWKKYSIVNRPSFLARVSTTERRKMDAPIRPDDITMVHLRPMEGTRYIQAPSNTPTMPGA